MLFLCATFEKEMALRDWDMVRRETLAGASGLSFFTPDTSLRGVYVYGNTILGTNTNALPALVALCPDSLSLQDTVLTNNVFLSLGAPFVSLDNSSGLNMTGNLYWAVSGSPSYSWGSSVQAEPKVQPEVQVVHSLSDWQALSGQEMVGGQPTGTDKDPGLRKEPFFQSCVDWLPSYPDIPNSPVLDAVRLFSGCS